MSAIAGIVNLTGLPLTDQILERMMSQLKHRGPNGQSEWKEGPAGLGHLRSWATSESVHGQLPHYDRFSGRVITSDARLDNRNELMAELGVAQCESEVITDSHLILRAYEKWGEECPAHLLGDFAFALWDVRHQRLLCARDHFGVKPFYYSANADQIAFATEMKALLALPDLRRELNELRVADYMIGLFEDKEITFYKNILRLPPGHCLVASRAGIKIQPYWILDDSQEVRLPSDAEYAEAFRDLFTEAVRCRLRSHLNVGAMLSGGLDSSSIVCTAQRLLSNQHDRKLKTFSAIFDNLIECDERQYINAVIAQNAVEPTFVVSDHLTPFTDLERIFWHKDEAFYAPSLFLMWGIYNAASQRNVAVMLDGYDGDTTVSHGYQYLNELANAGRWYRFYRETFSLAKRIKASMASCEANDIPIWGEARHVKIKEPAVVTENI